MPGPCAERCHSADDNRRLESTALAADHTHGNTEEGERPQMRDCLGFAIAHDAAVCLATALTVTLCTPGCVAPRRTAGQPHGALVGQTVYNKLSIHAERRRTWLGAERLSARLGHVTSGCGQSVVIPVNTPMTVRPVRRGCRLLVSSARQPIRVELTVGASSMDLSRYLLFTTSTTPVSFEGFSEADVEGIRRAEPLPGMSRAGVLAALGLPAPAETPTLAQDTWVYWTADGAALAVQFNADGRVAQTHISAGKR